MSLDFHDYDALHAVTPAALSAYARDAGWRKVEDFGDYSDVYAAEGKPEVILPRIDRLGDYPRVVSRLIQIFAEDAGRDELSLYRLLVTGDRDAVRVRVAESDDGSLAVNDGIDLLGGARDLLVSAACSLSRPPQPFYRGGANKEASDVLAQVRLGQTEQGSFAIVLLTPAVPPPEASLFPDPDDQEAPLHRRMTRRLAEALIAARKATEIAAASGESAFNDTVQCGVSANLCEALVKLVKPFPTLDIGISWARTRPLTAGKPTDSLIRFARTDAPILGGAARSLRAREPQPDMRLYGFVQRLDRGQGDHDGMIGLKTSIDGQQRSVAAMLKRADYERAIAAHEKQAFVVLTGDLERMGQRWRLLNPRLVDVVAPDDAERG